MVKIQKMKVSENQAGKTYYKHMINIPNHLIEELGWTDKTEVNIVKKQSKIIISE